MAPSSVIVSRYFLDSVVIVLYSSRLLGLLPFKYCNSEAQNRLQFSVAFAAYGVLSVIFLTAATIGGFLTDLKYGNNRLENSLDEYVTMVEIATMLFFLWTSCITFITERTSLLKFAYHLTQIDQILHLKDASQARKQSIYCISVVVLVLAILFAYTHYVWIVVNKIEIHAILYSAGYNMSYVVLLGLVVLYWVLSDGISQRLVALQDGLTYNSHKRNKYGEKLHSAHIMNMTFVYEHIYSALAAFSSAIGPMIFAEMTNIVITLISNMYLLIIQSAHGHSVWIQFMQLSWAACHIARLLAIVEPAQRLNGGMATIRMLISELLSVDMDKETKIQLDTLSTHLLLSPPGSFSPFGMVNVTRGVILTITGTVTTYVVLLLNFHKD